MNEPTKKQEEALREFLHSAVVPLIEDVLVKKLGQAMSYAKEQIATPKREWVGLTDEEIESSGKTDKVMLAQFFTSIESIDAMDDPIAQTMNLVIRQQGFDFARAIEAKLKEKNT